MEISNDTKFKTTENIAWRNVNDEIVILNLKSGEYFTLNDVAQCIWKAITDEKSVEEIKVKIIDEYDVSHEKADREIEDFISSMIEQRLLHKTV
ncbi:MAG: PqqD family protein [Thermodesulfobacteriota bacterium]|nr:PqqD family protein [Thermodesulfobacteriota bacterium]